MRRSQQGSASVVTLMLVLITIFLLHLCILLGSAIVERARVQAVADLGALAAADHLRWSTPLGVVPVQAQKLEACAFAAELVQRQAAELTQCVVLGTTVFSVQVEVAGMATAGASTQRARARAGPMF